MSESQYKNQDILVNSQSDSLVSATGVGWSLAFDRDVSLYITVMPRFANTVRFL